MLVYLCVSSPLISNIDLFVLWVEFPAVRIVCIFFRLLFYLRADFCFPDVLSHLSPPFPPSPPPFIICSLITLILSFIFPFLLSLLLFPFYFLIVICFLFMLYIPCILICSNLCFSYECSMALRHRHCPADVNPPASHAASPGWGTRGWPDSGSIRQFR